MLDIGNVNALNTFSLFLLKFKDESFGKKIFSVTSTEENRMTWKLSRTISNFGPSSLTKSHKRYIYTIAIFCLISQTKWVFYKNESRPIIFRYSEETWSKGHFSGPNFKFRNDVDFKNISISARIAWWPWVSCDVLDMMSLYFWIYLLPRHDFFHFLSE